jgi:uncharacterized protein (TIGR02246 family)
MTPTADETEAIRQLLSRYNFAIDLGDAEAWAACFTPDGSFECIGVPEDSPMGGRHEGSEALLAYARRHYATAKGHARHWNWNLDIDIDGDQATMRCYLLALSVGRNRLPQMGGAGIYRDKLRRVDGQWLFTERHVTVDT